MNYFKRTYSRYRCVYTKIFYNFARNSTKRPRILPIGPPRKRVIPVDKIYAIKFIRPRHVTLNYTRSFVKTECFEEERGLSIYPGNSIALEILKLRGLYRTPTISRCIEFYEGNRFARGSPLRSLLHFYGERGFNKPACCVTRTAANGNDINIGYGWDWYR